MNNNEGDRISELPGSVLHHILSFFDLKPAIQTSILSTKWRYVWRSLPFLNFHCNQFYSFETKRADGFVDFVDHVLNLLDSSSSIRKFHLSCFIKIDHSDIEDRLCRWILTALESNVEDLYLLISVGDEFQLPQCLFSCKSLRKLELQFYGHHPLHKLNLPDSMNLPGLKTLVLGGFRIEADDILNKIFSSCCVLESLKLTDSVFYQTRLDISAPQLKHLVILNYDYTVYDEIDINKYIIKLYAPNLISFCCHDYMSKDYYVLNLSALVKAEIDMDVEVYDKDGHPRLDEKCMRNG
ncbi:F-box domain [Macleaya cordata]|uniref:F-box domain n=1 Tax=Macleaya cordata TaxID=56857 RepID=A0A200QEL9_MACCD|nr:F-box domain [Macleaya cordata]